MILLFGRAAAAHGNVRLCGRPAGLYTSKMPGNAAADGFAPRRFVYMTGRPAGRETQ